MNLNDLNEIDLEEKNLLRKAKKFDDQAEYLANRRNSQVTLLSFIHSIRVNDSSFLQEIQNEVLEILNSMSHDVFRAVEMKFAAESRRLRTEAKIKNQQLKNFLPDNEVL